MAYSATLPQSLVDSLGLFATFLMAVVGLLGLLPVHLLPSDDELVDSVGSILVPALGQVGFPVEHGNGVVVSRAKTLIFPPSSLTPLAEIKACHDHSSKIDTSN